MRRIPRSPVSQTSSAARRPPRLTRKRCAKPPTPRTRVGAVRSTPATWGETVLGSLPAPSNHCRSTSYVESGGLFYCLFKNMRKVAVTEFPSHLLASHPRGAADGPLSPLAGCSFAHAPHSGSNPPLAPTVSTSIPLRSAFPPPIKKKTSPGNPHERHHHVAVRVRARAYTFCIHTQNSPATSQSRAATRLDSTHPAACFRSLSDFPSCPPPLHLCGILFRVRSPRRALWETTFFLPLLQPSKLPWGACAVTSSHLSPSQSQILSSSSSWWWRREGRGRLGGPFIYIVKGTEH